jgi:hypothetical protein
MKGIIRTFLAMPVGKKISLIFYPFFLIWQIPIAWFKSLSKSVILLEGRLSRYIGFSPDNAVNSLFYKTQFINLNKFGRAGTSSIIGLGNFSLKSWFHISVIANYIYTNAGAVTTLLGTLIWILGHCVWFEHYTFAQTAPIVSVLFFSSTAYAMAFARQNYQILGWMWFPIALFFMYQEQWILSSFCWVLAGFAGITQVFFSVILSFLFALKLQMLAPLLTTLPVGIIWLFYLSIYLFDKNFYTSALSTLKVVGLTKKEVRYHRKRQINLETIYFSALYSIGCFFFYLTTDHLPYLSIAFCGIFMMNQTMFRVADEQSLIILFVSIFAFEVLQEDFSWMLIGVLWLVANPHAFFVSIGKFSESNIYSIKVNAPFDHTPLLDKFKIFFSNVPEGEKVYFAFADPQGNYFNIFDGYRIILEAPLVVTAERNIHLFPDWYAVVETNYIGAPQCWGRSPVEVKDNLIRWNAKYAIVYQSTETDLELQWNQDFEEMGSFDWKDITPSLRGTALWANGLPTPKWFLIKLK